MQNLSAKKEEIRKNLWDLIVYIIIYILISKLGNLDWFKFEFIKDTHVQGRAQYYSYLSLTGILSYLIIKILLVIQKIFTPPIKIKLSITDFLTDEECTSIYFTSNSANITSKIKIKISILNMESSWQKLIAWIIKEKKIQLLINISPKSKYIGFQPERFTSQYEYLEVDNNYILSIDLSNLIKSNLDDSIPFEEEHLITITKEDEEELTSNCKYGIKPYLILSNRKIGFILKKLIKLDNGCTDGYYKIRLIIDKENKNEQK